MYATVRVQMDLLVVPDDVYDDDDVLDVAVT